MTILIGLTGYKHSGKDTLAKHILSRVPGGKKYAYADPLKAVCHSLFGWDLERLNNDPEYKESADDPYCQMLGMSRRQLLQFIGTECFRERVDPDFWVKLTMTKIEQDNPKYAIISDVRFPNEAHAVWDRGGVIARVHRPDLGEPVDTHQSETNIKFIIPDFIIRNNMDSEWESAAGLIEWVNSQL
ncbi:MAG: hypothetical protein D6698_15905 [Gammaproteobacteria bacterium]|nr:MAG: hypothetical protein D6698_15905 [Gammaproteobacteria bacterium]